jgi:hypothetical protein
MAMPKKLANIEQQQDSIQKQQDAMTIAIDEIKNLLKVKE